MHTAKRDTLQVLTRVILDKWPEDKGDVPIAAIPYFTIWDELSIQNGIVFCGETLLHGVRSGIILCRERAAILKSLPLMTKHLLVQDVTLRQHQKIVATTQCQAKCYSKTLNLSPDSLKQEYLQKAQVKVKVRVQSYKVVTKDGQRFWCKGNQRRPWTPVNWRGSHPLATLSTVSPGFQHSASWSCHRQVSRQTDLSYVCALKWK